MDVAELPQRYASPLLPRWSEEENANIHAYFAPTAEQVYPRGRRSEL